MARRVVWLGVGLGLALVLAGVLPAHVVGPPILALVILRVGLASYGSLRAGAPHIPDGPPALVDQSRERITYWCDGCGAELLLLVRGTDMAPRHCGERMSERTEVPRTTS